MSGTTFALAGTGLHGQEHDLYDLPLTTTAAAAELFRDAQQRLLRVQVGVETPLQAAVSSDPGFALGHATLAVMGHDFDVPVDTAAHLRAALDTAPQATLRERSFVAAVAARIRGADDHKARLRQHLAEHPRDALALNMAVPTMAFSGAVEVPEEAWALVEAGDPVFGADPWFSGLLAFVRQEQGRFGEADTLALRALGADPSAGHAAHAMAHVYYESGRHADGLRWIDDWICDNRATTFQPSHYSWHAALHELALGDDTAVRRRYVAELAPAHVQGVRALVDSASLLWRARLSGSWHGELPIEEVLSVVDEGMLVEPQTPFVAMHSAVALAAGGDADGLRLLGRHAAADVRRDFRELVTPFAAAMHALVQRRPGRASDMLLQLMPDVERFGGSKAQREVVERTLLFALVESGRTDTAQDLVQLR
ncbi:MAG: FAD/NAD(P)-binding protein, partial [Actinomycetes bacterium]